MVLNHLRVWVFDDLPSDERRDLGHVEKRVRYQNREIATVLLARSVSIGITIHSNFQIAVHCNSVHGSLCM